MEFCGCSLDEKVNVGSSNFEVHYVIILNYVLCDTSKNQDLTKINGLITIYTKVCSFNLYLFAKMLDKI